MHSYSDPFHLLTPCWLWRPPKFMSLVCWCHCQKRKMFTKLMIMFRLSFNFMFTMSKQITVKKIQAIMCLAYHHDTAPSHPEGMVCSFREAFGPLKQSQHCWELFCSQFTVGVDATRRRPRISPRMNRRTKRMIHLFTRRHHLARSNKRLHSTAAKNARGMASMATYPKEVEPSSRRPHEEKGLWNLLVY